jgi:MoaA/NifB/PqqE/SkfB family radical SAM enzyme
MNFNKERNKRILDFLTGKKVGPLRIELLLNNHCNLNCVFCYRNTPEFRKNSRYLYRNELSLSKLLDLVKQAHNLNVFEWYISGGGEPFFYNRKLMKVIHQIRKYGMNGNINTNGTMLNSSIIKDIINLKWDTLTLSIESSDEKIHDALVGRKNSFSKIEKNLELLKYYKWKYSSKKPDVQFHTIINKSNYASLPSLVNFAKKYKVSTINFVDVIPLTSEARKLKLKDFLNPQVRKSLIKTRNLCRKNKIVSNIDFYLKNKPKNDKVKFCFEPIYDLIILADGTLGLCSKFEPSKNSCENVKKKTLHQFWFGHYATKIRTGVLNGKMSVYCKRCPSSILFENNELFNSFSSNLLEFNIESRKRKEVFYKFKDK